MDIAKDHWKILVILLAVGLGISSIVLFDSPVIGGITSPSPSASTSPTPQVTQAANAGTAPAGVKAGTFGITITLAPTKPPAQTGACNKMAVDLVLDTSSSMKNPSSHPRIQTLKDAVKSFIDTMPDAAVFSAQRFDKQARSITSPVLLAGAREGIKGTISDLSPSGDGGTHTSEGLYKAKRMIEEGNTMFPGREWTLILLSDGAPNPKSQDGTEAASALKGMGVHIITIGLDLDEEENVTPEEARDHMRRIASSPSDFYDAQSDSLDSIYLKLSDSLCK